MLTTPQHPPYLQIVDFLSQQDRKAILEYAINNESRFQSATVTTGVVNYRQASVLHYFPEFDFLVTDKVRAAIPEWCEALGIEPFEQKIDCTPHPRGAGWG